MNTNQLKYFISVADTGSFSAAAEENYITQTAMTQQIKALEEDLGLKLFDRSTRPVTLTSAGASFLSDARLILKRLGDARQRAAEASTGIFGTLRIGYIKGYERSGLSDQLRAFHRMVPGVLLMCYRDTSDRLAAGLQNGEYDIIFTWDSTNLKSAEGFEAIEIEKARLYAALYAALAGLKSLHMLAFHDLLKLVDGFRQRLDPYGKSSVIFFKSFDRTLKGILCRGHYGLNLPVTCR